ncbi:MAG: preprotein translocase subunit SecE [Salinisphaeraceae bacterium]|jgi:preprotein translocase subunit SecE|nr:preprotein translocase subunit SecE [Salinisphaeraceae bacterium]
MATREEQSGSFVDTALLWLAVGVLSASIFGYYWFEPQYNDLVRVLGMLAGAGLAIVIALQTALGKTAWGYIQGSRTELRRVVWPTRQETMQTTLMVIVVVLILSVFIWALDVVLAWAVQMLTGR